jgi:hypothetical protein
VPALSSMYAILTSTHVPVANRQPLYLRDHDKKILKAALWNDSKLTIFTVKEAPVNSTSLPSSLLGQSERHGLFVGGRSRQRKQGTRGGRSGLHQALHLVRAFRCLVYLPLTMAVQGQETRILGKGSGWSRSRRTHNCDTKAMYVCSRLLDIQH